MNWVHSPTSANAALGFRNESDINGSHMPLRDGLTGWSWRNPLNLLPLSIGVLAALGFVLSIFGLR